jgi:hypothetical protein
MLLHVLPKKLSRKATIKLSLNPHEPNTFDHGKLHIWILARISAAKAIATLGFLAPAATIPMTFTSPTAPPTSQASIYLINSTDLTTSSASTASPTSIGSPAPLAPMASTASTAPTSTLVFPVSLTLATAKTHMAFPALAIYPASTACPTSLASPVPLAITASISCTARTCTSVFPDFSTPATPKTHTTPPASLAPTASMASTASTAPLAFAVGKIPTTTPPGGEDTSGAGPTVRLGIVGVEPPRGPPVR